jgi:hypothetical protein
MTLQTLALADSPPFVVNVAGPETLSVRRVAMYLGELLGKPVAFRGTEGTEALLSNGQLGHELFGYPRVAIRQLCQWIADWLHSGGDVYDKPTMFQVSDGKF